MSKADVFDLLGVCLLALFGYAIWPPLCLGLIGIAALLAGRAAHGADAK